MTNKEYITASLSGTQVSDSDIDIILLKAGLDGDADVSISDCDMAIYNRFSIILKGMAANVSQGGYSVSWNMEAVKLYYAALCEELEVDNVLVDRPKVRNLSNMW